MALLESQIYAPSKRLPKERQEQARDELNTFLNREMAFLGDTTTALSDSEKLSLYLRYLNGDDYSLATWKDLVGHTLGDRAAMSDSKNELSTLSLEELQSYLLFCINKLPQEIVDRYLQSLAEHMSLGRIEDADEFIEIVTEHQSTALQAAEQLKKFAERRQALIADEARRDGANPTSYRIGFHTSDHPVTGTEVDVTRGRIESYGVPGDFVDVSGVKFVAVDPKCLYHGSYLSVVELPHDVEPVPQKPAWFRSQSGFHIRGSFPLNDELMRTFGLSFEE